MKSNTDYNKLKLLLDTVYFPLSGGRINGKTIFSKLVQFIGADKKKTVSIQNGMIEGANVSYFGVCNAEQASRQYKEVSIQGVESFSLRVGTSIAVKFATNNSYSATAAAPIALNVNNTGPKNIYYNAGIPTGTDVIAFGKANTTNFYMYDGTYWVFVGSGQWPDTATYKNQFLNYAYPVGSIYVSTKNVSPATFLGGTWISLSGYMLRGATSGVTANSNAKDGGNDNLIIPYHNHTFTGSAVNTGASTASNTGIQSANHTHTVNGGATNTGSKSAYATTDVYGASGSVNLKMLAWAGKKIGNDANIQTQFNHAHSQVAHTHSVGNNSVDHTHDMKHTHSVTAAGTVGYAGTDGNTTNANLPNYKNVYMWERTA